MNLKLSWEIFLSDKTKAIGMCEDLPDSYSTFTVIKLSDEAYWAIPPTLRADANKIILRDKEIAKDFCNDFLNNNLKEIIRFQIKSMKGSSAATQNSLRHYEDFLEKVMFLENNQ